MCVCVCVCEEREEQFAEFDKKCLGLESRTEPLSGCINNLRNHAQLHTVTSRTVKKWQTPHICSHRSHSSRVNYNEVK